MDVRSVNSLKAGAAPVQPLEVRLDQYTDLSEASRCDDQPA